MTATIASSASRLEPNPYKPSRFRIGIYHSDCQTSGVTRYVDAILDHISNRDEFEVTFFCSQNSPYEPRAGIRCVTLPERTAPESHEAIDAELNLGHARPRSSLLRLAWRRCAPEALKLWAGYLQDARRLADCFRRCPVDLLHIQLVNVEEGTLAARLARVPRVLGTLHIDTHNSRYRDLLLEFISNRALTRAIAVSETIKRQWVRRTCLHSDRVTTIANGVDPGRYCRHSDQATARNHLGIPENALLVGSIGRLALQKGYSDLLDAMAVLIPEYPDLALVIAGDGPERQRLTDQAHRLNISKRVYFLGHRVDVQPVLDSIDIFALPSLWEALPFSLLEAMSTGLPAVGTRVAGVPEVIVQGQTGLLVRPSKPKEFADALKMLIDSQELRRSMGHRARIRVIQSFNEAFMVARTFDTYREMLQVKTS